MYWVNGDTSVAIEMSIQEMLPAERRWPLAAGQQSGKLFQQQLQRSAGIGWRTILIHFVLIYNYYMIIHRAGIIYLSLSLSIAVSQCGVDCLEMF